MVNPSIEYTLARANSIGINEIAKKILCLYGSNFKANAIIIKYVIKLNILPVIYISAMLPPSTLANIIPIADGIYVIGLYGAGNEYISVSSFPTYFSSYFSEKYLSNSIKFIFCSILCNFSFSIGSLKLKFPKC